MWVELLKDNTGVVLAGALVVQFFRSLVKGDVVLGREYNRVVVEMTAIAKRADEAVSESKASSERERLRDHQMIELQQQRITEQESRIAALEAGRREQ